MSTQLLFTIDERSRVASARRDAMALATSLGFDETGASKVALAVTEAATNILKHACHGKLLLRPLEGASNGLEILALDRGPGIANVAASLRDGHSTSGSMGTGLGALSRLSPGFEIYSQPGQGTAIRLQLWAELQPNATGTPASGLEIGVVCVAKHGEAVCGDDWTFEPRGDGGTILVADGLGHGPDAARAARTAVAVLRTRPGFEPGALLEIGHGALVSTRGAAVGVARIDLASGQVNFAGVGNIVCRMEALGQRSRHLVSHNGTLGHAMHRVQEFSLPFTAQEILILHSDGLATHWDLAGYPGLMGKHAALIAGVLWRDYDRGRDDVTVVVARKRGGV